jgi:hypothetical protein
MHANGDAVDISSKFHLISEESAESQPLFQRNMSCPSSWLKSEPSKKQYDAGRSSQDKEIHCHSFAFELTSE